jgi:hypothetical protein
MGAGRVAARPSPTSAKPLPTRYPVKPKNPLLTTPQEVCLLRKQKTRRRGGARA